MTAKLPEPQERLAGKYLIEQVIGEGGFGRVYLATTDDTGRKVAIKVLKPAPGGKQDVKTRRFLQELKTVAQLSHPNTMTLYDYGTTAEGLQYMVCEYVPGEDLSELLERRRRLSDRETSHVLQQALESLREAHNVGMLHRDIKPDNIRLTEYRGDPLVVKVLDFGIAKSLDSDQPGLTATGKVIGTPRYMSPEQLMGERLTPASDIFSLGLVAYDMLAGSHAGRQRRVAHGTVEVPAAPDINEDLRAVVNRMLQPDPANRFSTTEQVLRALRAVQWEEGDGGPTVEDAEVPTLVPVVSTAEDTVPRSLPLPENEGWSKRSTIVGAVAGCLLTLLAVYWGSDSAPEPRRVQPVPARNVLKLITKTTPSAMPDRAVGHEPIPDIGLDVATDDVTTSGCGQPPPADDDHGLIRRRISQGEISFYFPTGYDPSTRYPIVLLLHAAMQSPGRFIDVSGIGKVADEQGFVVIAPRSKAIVPWSHDGDADYIRNAIAYVDTLLCLDQSRLFVFGHGAGSEMAEELPCRIDGIDAIATTAYRSTGALMCPNYSGRSVPHIHFTGLDDGYLPPKGGRACNGIHVISLEDHDAFWRENEHCSGPQKAYLEVGANECFTWDCENEYVSCHLAGGRGFKGQEGRELDLLDCDGDQPDFDISAVAWKFFESQAPRD